MQFRLQSGWEKEREGKKELINNFPSRSPSHLVYQVKGKGKRGTTKKREKGKSKNKFTFIFIVPQTERKRKWARDENFFVCTSSVHLEVHLSIRFDHKTRPGPSEWSRHNNRHKKGKRETLESTKPRFIFLLERCSLVSLARAPVAQWVPEIKKKANSFHGPRSTFAPRPWGGWEWKKLPSQTHLTRPIAESVKS